MVGPSTDDSDIDSVSLVPSCIPIDDVDSVSCVEIVDGSFSVDLPYLKIACQSVNKEQRNITAKMIRKAPIRSRLGIDRETSCKRVPSAENSRRHIMFRNHILSRVCGEEL